jgi:phosphoribosylformylglycinamidine synthase subunit II (EC 6.3.5.3)
VKAVYVLGLTKNELGGSEYADALGVCGAVPQVDAVSARIRYERMFEAIQAGLITAAHDVSDGGLAVAVAEMALAGRIGATSTWTRSRPWVAPCPNSASTANRPAASWSP